MECAAFTSYNRPYESPLAFVPNNFAIMDKALDHS